MEQQPQEMWGLVSLMGHGKTAGRISKPTDWGGLLRVDVPEGDGFATEMYGAAAIFSIKFVSEEIARAYAQRPTEIAVYDSPIITREQHEEVVRLLTEQKTALRRTVNELQYRLTAVAALPPPDEGIIPVERKIVQWDGNPPGGPETDDSWETDQDRRD